METYLTKAQRLVLQAAIRWLEKHDDPKIDQITRLAEIDYLKGKLRKLDLTDNTQKRDKSF